MGLVAVRSRRCTDLESLFQPRAVGLLARPVPSNPFSGGRGVLVRKKVTDETQWEADSTRKAGGRNRLGQGMPRERERGGGTLFGVAAQLPGYNERERRVIIPICLLWARCSQKEHRLS